MLERVPHADCFNRTESSVTGESARPTRTVSCIKLQSAVHNTKLKVLDIVLDIILCGTDSLFS